MNICKFNTYASISLLFSSISLVHAALPNYYPVGGPFLELEAGISHPTNSTDSMHVNNGGPAPYHLDTFTVGSFDNKRAVGLSAGYNWCQTNRFMTGASLGLRYLNVGSSSEVSGQIIQYGIPEFTNYNYSWNFDSNYFSLFTKLNFMSFGLVNPFLNLGLGATMNHANGYQETAIPPVTARVSPGFTNDSHMNFAYDAGIGIDVTVLPQWVFSLKYDFINLGEIKSGYGVSTWSSERLNLGTFKTHAALLAVSYYFDDLAAEYK